MTRVTSGTKSSSAFPKQYSFLQDTVPHAVFTESNSIITIKLKGIKRRLSFPSGMHSKVKLLMPALNLSISIATLGCWSRSSLFKEGSSSPFLDEQRGMAAFLPVYFNYF